jgi:quercetin dioxygenase-like cupin family protein
MTEPMVLYTPDLPGEESKPFPGNAEVVTLRDAADLGAATYLVRLPPGGEITPHSHAGAAQHFVLEGECESGGTTRKAGTYHLIPAHATVGPVTSRAGAVMLIILDPSPA